MKTTINHRRNSTWAITQRGYYDSGLKLRGNVEVVMGPDPTPIPLEPNEDFVKRMRSHGRKH